LNCLKKLFVNQKSSWHRDIFISILISWQYLHNCILKNSVTRKSIWNSLKTPYTIIMPLVVYSITNSLIIFVSDIAFLSKLCNFFLENISYKLKNNWQTTSKYSQTKIWYFTIPSYELIVTRISTRLSAPNTLWIIRVNVTIKMLYKKNYKIPANFNSWIIGLKHFILMLGNMVCLSSNLRFLIPWNGYIIHILALFLCIIFWNLTSHTR